VDVCDSELKKTEDNPEVVQAMAKCIGENGESACKQKLMDSLEDSFIKCYGICDSSFKDCDWSKRR